MIPAQGLQQLPIEDFSAGQRTTGTMFSRTPSSPKTQNMVSYVDKLLRKRPGYDTEGIPSIGTSPVSGIYEYNLDSSTQFQMQVSGGTISYMTNFNKQWTTLQTTGLTPGAISEWETFQTGTQKYLIHCTHNNDQLYYWDGKTKIMSPINTPGAPRPKYIISWQNQLWAAGIPGFESRIQWSNIATYDQWQTNGVTNYDDNCNTGDGDYITGMGVLRGNLYIFKRFSIFQITYLGGAPLIQVKRIVNGLGCVANQTICDAKITATAFDGTVSKYEILMFLTPDKKIVGFDGLYTYTLSDGMYESNDYANIWMKNMNDGQLINAHAVYWERENLYILFFANGQSPTINCAICMNKVTRGIWPWTNMNFNTSGMWTGPNKYQIPYGGDYNGQVYRLMYGSHDTIVNSNQIMNAGFEDWPSVSTGNLITNEDFENWTTTPERTTYWPEGIDAPTVLALEMDGTGTSFVDSSISNKAVTANGNATQLPIKFNKSAGFFNGTTDYVVVPTSTDFNFGTGDFDIEFFVMFNTVQTCTLFERSAKNLAIRYAAGHLYVYQATAARINYTFTPSANVWYHIRVDRVSGTTSLYIDNTVHGTPYAGTDNITASSGLFIGAIDGGASEFSAVWMKELRVSKVARTVAVPTTEYTTDANTVLLMHFDTPATSPLNSAISFNGSSAYLTLATSTDWNFTTNPFCLEGWFKFNTVAGTQELFDRNASADFQVILTAGVIKFYTGSTLQITHTTTMVANKWYHISAFRVGTGASQSGLSVDGVVVSGTITTNISSAIALGIGSQYNGANYFNGSAREIRISNVARYTIANFTPSQNGFTVDANTVLYIKGAENNGATSFVDSSSSVKTITNPSSNTVIKYTEDYRSCIFKDETGKFPYPVGSAKVDFFAIGSGVGYFDGTNSYVTTPDSTDFTMGSGDFDVEFYMRPFTVNAVTKGIVCHLDGSNYGWIQINQQTAAVALFVSSNGSSWDKVSNQTIGSVLVNTWFHVAVTRSRNSLYYFFNGSLIGTVDVTGVTLADSNQVLNIGQNQSLFYAGLLDNIRISKGVARYTAVFNPPGVYTTSPSTTPNTWTFGGVDIGTTTEAQSTNPVYSGTYALQMITTGTDQYVTQSIPIGTYAGTTFVGTVWVYAPTGTVRIDMNDGVSVTQGGTNSSNNAWQQITVTKTLSPLATTIELRVRVLSATTAYIDLANLAETALVSDWTLGGTGAALTQVASSPAPHGGNYSAGVTRVGTDAYLSENYTDFNNAQLIAYWQGKTLTLACWVFASTASTTYIQIADNVGSTNSSYHTGNSTWQQLSVTRTINAGATDLNLNLYVANSNTTSYFDDTILFDATNRAALVTYLPIESFWETDLLDVKRPDVLKKAKYLTVYMKPRSNTTVEISRAAGWEFPFREQKYYTYNGSTLGGTSGLNMQPLGTGGLLLGTDGTPLGVDYGVPMHYDVPEVSGQFRFRIYENSTLESFVIHRIDFSQGPEGLGTTELMGVSQQ